MTNAQVARIFAEVADILEILGENPYRVQAYRRAAQIIENLTEDIVDLARRDELEKIPGIGASIAQKVKEIVATGRLKQHEELKAKIPPGLLEMLQIPGMGPKKVLLVYKRLGIDSVQKLEEAAKAGRLRGLPGMGAKTEQNILRGIQLLRSTRGRLPLGIALPAANKIVAELKELPQVERITTAGSLRRMKETIGDIDILITSPDPKPVMDRFVSMPMVKEVLAHGTTKSSVIIDAGTQVDLRVVPPESFGAAQQYFTGSKDHNIRLRELAIKKGLKINEYGVFKADTGERLAGEHEEEMYAALDMPWIPPEMRENWGEIEAALEGRLPKLIELPDIKGDLHVHTKWTDGGHTIEEMARKAKELGYEYLGVCDHSKAMTFVHGLDERRLLEQVKEIRALNERLKGIRVLTGVEVDILPDGSLDLAEEVLDQVDIVVASVHSKFKMKEAEMTERIIRAMRKRCVDIIGHPTGRIIGEREPYEVDFDKLLEVAAETKTALEINAFPERLDLKDVHARAAKERGVMLAINTDAHSVFQLEWIIFGVAVARRGWVEPQDVLNTKPLEELLEWLHHRYD